MKKFITGLRYGNWQTRLYVISIPVSILLGIGLIVVSFIVNWMILFLIGVALGIAAIVLIQKVTIEEVTVIKPESEKAEPEIVNEEPPKSGKAEPEIVNEEPPKSGKAEPEIVNEEPPKSGKAEPETVNEEPPKSGKAEPEIVNEEPPKSEEEKAETVNVEKPEKNKTEKSRPEKKEDELSAYDKRKIKQVFYRYKVRKDHKMIMIDTWKAENVYQCPVYIWVHRGRVHFLLIEEETRELTIPVTKAATIKYHRGVVCKAKEEYLQFRKSSLISAVFEPYLPTYRSGNKNGRPIVYKNLFELGDGILITNTSVKTIMDLLQPEFQVEDSVTRDKRYNSFFVEIYKNSILFREQIISTKVYQDRVNTILQQLAGSGTDKQEYEKTLEQLYRNQLITQEYITYYLEYRGQMETEEEQIRQGKKIRKKRKKKR